jgi:hypothetical protein
MDAGGKRPLYMAGAPNDIIQIFNNTDRYILWIQDATGISQYALYKGLFGFSIMTIIIQGASTKVALDGAPMISDPGGRCPNFNGLNIDTRLAWFAASSGTHDLCALRLWNYPGGALPAGWETEVHKRCTNPWDRSPTFGDANLRLEYLLNEDIADASLVIPNSANPGVGDLTIAPAGQWQNVRELWRQP